MANILTKLLKDESGAAAAEYALILAVIGSGIALAALALGAEIEDAIVDAENDLAAVDSAVADAPDTPYVPAS